ncbi:hypothetical protein DO021_22160 [Desulfobacter hydrogenophilus]|uniref:RepB family plasmid replication initiator protein n=1 Tax=Desulfobacter hydrogenophilus TaxID=2291 RepID=A0A328F6L7_9BACT|nr:replication initiation protein [Desulfobacter hydrogenophilus]NDY74573.1 replication initiation protein [Desulfobacter hydrogenophilus]QBH15742.1 RepB family plasmid replication initiator protein [Desulfobacter hydrogenophilus]RAL99865.1 hypothetical protein DO021_22160 [Desulfobacter hydrogenophilus]
MDKSIIMNRNQIVKKSNALCRARHTTDSIWIGRLAAIVAAQVRKDDKEFQIYKIPVQQMLAAAGISRTGSIYRDLLPIAEKAMQKTIRIEEEGEWVLYTLFSKCRYKRGDGFVTVRFDPDLKLHFLNLGEKVNFTEYALIEYMSLQSTYSQHLFEYLMSWNDRPIVEIELAELHEKLATPPGSRVRKNFYDFERKILALAHKEIQKITSLRFEYEILNNKGQIRKKGQAAKIIRFVFSKGKVAKIAKRQKQADQKKQSAKNNTLFLSAVQCAQAHKDQGGCGKLRGTQECCKACMESKKTVETELDLFNQKKN